MRALLLLLISNLAFAAAPQLSAVAPATGPLSGGTVITLSGSGFVSGAAVTVGGYPCGAPVTVSDTQLTCSTPEHVAATSDVVVSNHDGGTASLPKAFQFQGTATFTLLQHRVFDRQLMVSGVLTDQACTKCHSGAKPAGKVDTTVYAQVLNEVKPEDAADSKLYTIVLSDKMPKSTPTAPIPALLPEEKQAIFDWIQDGAKNN